MTFKQFMKKLDEECDSRFGVSIHDLPDMPFRDWYDEYDLSELETDDMAEEMENFLEQIKERADIPDEL